MLVCIPFRSFTAKSSLEIEVPDTTEPSFRLRAALKIAVKGGADLSGANLSDANLYGANLSRANLSHADLSRANLSDADLSGANLSRADLSGANLSDANLYGANLSRANLSHADLSRANLSRANLSRADLSGANLYGAKHDLWDVLLRAKHEVPALLAALREGRIDGSTYQGSCSCLAGTIATARGVSYRDLGFANASRPIERLFLAIRKGDTPETSIVAKLVEGWIVEFQTLLAL